MIDKYNGVIANPAIKQRIGILDSLRGLAMFGIILVNFPSMNTYSGHENSHYGGVQSSLNMIASKINFMFFNGKFYPIFAMLFGLGLFIFYQNAKEKTLNPIRLTMRRLLILTLFGIMHIAFVWWGDILFLYSILGFYLLFMMERPAKTIFKMVCVLLILFPSLLIASTLCAHLYKYDLNQSLFTVIDGFNLNQDFLFTVYSEGSFAHITQQRLIDYVHDSTLLFGANSLNDLIFLSGFNLQVLGSMSLGLFIGKMGWHKRIEQYRAEIKIGRGIFFVMSVLLTILAFIPAFEFLSFGLKILQGESFALFYILSFLILLKKYENNLVARYFQSVGKMSLTAYILHTLTGSILLYGYGFALFEKIGSFALQLTAFFVYVVIAIFCNYWLKKFQFGPLEYIWRSLTYHMSSHVLTAGSSSER